MDGPDINSPFAQALIQEGTKRGYSPFDIAGSIGNAFQENSLKTDGLPGDKGTAFGGMQWRKERYDALKAEAQRQGKDWTDPSVQASHWYNEQDAAGTKGNTSIFDGNNAAIDSLRPRGFKADADNNEGVLGYAERLAHSKAAYKQMTGQDAPDDSGDYPAAGAQNASATGMPQGIMDPSQQQQLQSYQPTMTDSLDKLSAAFLRRDSPAAAAQIDNALQAKINGQRAELKAQQATEAWKAGKPFQAADGNYYTPKTNDKGQTSYDAVPKGMEPKESVGLEDRPLIQAKTQRDTAITNMNNYANTDNHILTLMEAARDGKIQLGPDMSMKTWLENVTGNSSEGGRLRKDLDSTIIGAATDYVNGMKGSATNFKFLKELERTAPMGAIHDPKALYDALGRAHENLSSSYRSNYSNAVTASELDPRLATTFDENAQPVSVKDHFAKYLTESTARNKALQAGEAEFKKQPGRGAPKAAPSLFDHVLGN